MDIVVNATVALADSSKQGENSFNTFSFTTKEMLNIIVNAIVALAG